uniref:Uncharacterized protein n=1 Tax=Clytia hemisphaerica TaxID=252671 RepID=A0A7M5V0H7_9CNID|eukprot:TCONS_00066628-protein
MEHYLVTQSIKEENIKFRKKVLDIRDISSRGWYGKLILNYRKWYKEITGREDYLTDESGDESDDSEEEEEEEDYPLWLKHFISPHILTTDDDNNSDDGLDGNRESVKVFFKGEQGKFFASKMARLSRERNNTTDPVVESFMSNLENVKAPGHNHVYTLKIQLLNIREDINRVIKVPARLSLCTLQEKVFCLLMGWLPVCVSFGYK